MGIETATLPPDWPDMSGFLMRTPEMRGLIVQMMSGKWPDMAGYEILEGQPDRRLDLFAKEWASRKGVDFEYPAFLQNNRDD